MFKKRFGILAAGSLAGVITGLLGAGGGIITVPLLKKAGLSQKESHCNAIAVILPITVFSAVIYLYKGYVTLNDALIYMPTGVLGAVIGTFVLNKIKPKWLNIIFSALMIYAGVRLLLR